MAFQTHNVPKREQSESGSGARICSSDAATIHRTLQICAFTATHHKEETDSLACGFPATPAMACWPICIGPMAPMPPTGAPVGRGPMPMAPGPPPTPVRLVRAFMGSSRRVNNRQYYAAPTCAAEIMSTVCLVEAGPAEDRTRQRKPNVRREPTENHRPLTWTPQRLLICGGDAWR